MVSIVLEIGWVGFGLAGGAVPSVSLGIFRVGITRGFLAAALTRAVEQHRHDSTMAKEGKGTA